MARGFYPLEENPEYQDEVERLLNTDPVRAEDSFFGSLLLRILNNIKAAWLKAVAAKETADKAIPAAEKGAPGGVATLSPDGKLEVTVTAGEVGAMPANTPIVPPTRKVAGKPLTSDITLGPGDVGAAPAKHTHTPAEAGAAAANHTHTAAQVGASPSNHTHTAAQVGAAAAGHTHTPAQAGAAAASHTHAAGQVTAGTLAAGVVASFGTDYGTTRLRNIRAGIADLTPGVSALNNGEIYIVYE